MKAYYNDNDPYVCAWISNLIKAGEISHGDVDDRPIQKIRPKDLDGYVQHHFFAGIGGWALALKLAGWPDDRPCWTGSPPCQPFSTAGKRKGFTDKRHLWPAWFRLIRRCRPGIIFGEQVGSRDGLAWLDLVSRDLERTSYAIGALDLCAAGAGAPHIRQRLYIVADSAHADGRTRKRQAQERTWAEELGRRRSSGGGASDRMAKSDGGFARVKKVQRGGQQRQQPQDRISSEMELSASDRRGATPTASEKVRSHPEISGRANAERPRSSGFWSDAGWLLCRDGKYRPVPLAESEVLGVAPRIPSGVGQACPERFPVTGKTPRRIARLRGFGNSIVPPLAAEFVKAYMELKP